CDGLYFDIRILHRTASRALTNLAAQLLSGSESCLEFGTTHRLLANIIRHTLCRGYADGLRHFLRRHEPQALDPTRIRSGPRLPWVLLHHEDQGLRSITVGWTVRRPWTEPD